MRKPTDIQRYRENLQAEVDAATQYRAMADSERQAEVADVYRKLAAIEDKHASFWEDRLAGKGVPVRPR
ncbi:MAG: VIT1/CCC1 transporter family protein, partial [Polyangiaceae bacterium]